MAEEISPTFEIPEEDFWAASAPPDVKGRINIRIEQALQKELEDIAENRNYPLHSMSEVVRFCLLEGIKKLRQWKPQPTLLPAIRAANAIAIRDKIQCEATDVISKMDERIQWYARTGNFDQAIELIGQIRSYFEGVQQTFWSQYMLQQIDAKFEEWLNMIDTARKNEVDSGL